MKSHKKRANNAFVSNCRFCTGPPGPGFLALINHTETLARGQGFFCMWLGRGRWPDSLPFSTSLTVNTSVPSKRPPEVRPRAVDLLNEWVESCTHSFELKHIFVLFRLISQINFSFIYVSLTFQLCFTYVDPSDTKCFCFE